MTRIRALLLAVVPVCLLFILLFVSLDRAATASPSLSTPPAGTAIKLNPNSHQAARLTYHNEAVFGPNCTTGNGDPFSPTDSVLRPPNHYTNPQYSSDYYSYRYRIDIPASYSEDVVRVELFDPDSYNHSPGLVNLDLTQYVISHSIPYGFPSTITAQCSSSAPYRYNACILTTGESSSLNPLWFVRVDEIRTRSGNSCGAPSGNIYNNGQPTETAFDLYYYGQTITGTTQTNPLANYMGPMDNVHDTDLRWVSPGGAQSYDQPTFVPANFGSFEVNLTTIPDILVDPTTGIRSLYLDVTTLVGASENGFEIWAGPPVYTGPQGTTNNGCATPVPGQVAGVPSQVNKRNLHIVNCAPSSHDSAGITVYALDYAPTNANSNASVARPLTYLGPEYAGQSIYVTLFDSDTGSRPPVVFYFDTLAFNLLNPVPATPANPVNTSLTDYYRAFGVNNTLTADPDLLPGQTRNCLPGGCQNQWVTPSYRIDIPTLSPDCVDMQTTPLLCTPFYGGTLMVYTNPGSHDTYTWHVDVPEVAPPNRALGCTGVFPVALDRQIRSVTPVEYLTVLNSSQYPTIPPSYASLVAAGHTSNHPLSNQAQPGDTFLFQGQGTGFLNFGWLLWDSVNQPNSGATLAESLTWPGDSYLYHDPTEPTDTSFHQDDWVALNSSLNSGTAAASPLAGHIDRGRILRLVVQSGVSPEGVQIEQMADFRVLAYRLNVAENDRWLLLQFVNYVTSCGQNVPPQVSFAAAAPFTDENVSSGVFSVTVQLIPAYGLTVTTAFSSTDGTALAGQDYLPVQGVITFTAGMTQTVIPVPLLNDTLAEGNEWFNLTLSDPVNGHIAGPNPAQLIIADDECLYSLYAVPGRLEMEDFSCGGEGVAYHETTPTNTGNSTYRLLEGVDVWDNAAASQAHYLGNTVTGEWLIYTINSSTTQKYDLRLAAASALLGQCFQIDLDGVDITGMVTLPVTGETFVETMVVEDLLLTAGTHQIRLSILCGGANYDYLSFTPSPDNLFLPVLLKP